MNNIKSLIAALTFAGLTACADNSPKTFSGFITDASMNTVTVRALTDESTCTFATTDADKSDANGLLLGAPVTVDYTGKLKDGTAATKIATDPTYAEAVGKWTMPDPIAPEGVMGVEIMVEGAARSINMATLVYTSWELQGEADKILLKGQSLGNGQTIDFTQTGMIAKTADGNYTACAVIPTFALPVPSAGTASSHSSSHTIVQCPVVEMLNCKVVFPASKFSEAGTA